MKNGSSVGELDGLQKAAVLLITLGPEKAANIFKHLKEEEIEQLTLEIANTRSVSPSQKEEVLNEFYEVCLPAGKQSLDMPRIFCRKHWAKRKPKMFLAN